MRNKEEKMGKKKTVTQGGTRGEGGEVAEPMVGEGGGGGGGGGRELLSEGRGGRLLRN